jgi:predicted nucleic acid-binding Zn ribbon protein
LKSVEPSHCYLCGKPLDGSEAVNVDHIPPQQILVKEVRRKYPIRFVTRKVHAACNSAYKLDEEYFVHSLIPFARGTEAGDALFSKTVLEYRKGKNRPLVNKVLSQAVPVVRGIYLPPGKVALQLDLERFNRVVSKIVRGLYFCEFDTILDPQTEMFVSLTPPGEPPPDHFIWFMTHCPTESCGEHQGVFAYRYIVTEDGVNYWALLLWDRVIITATFRHPRQASKTESAEST